MVNWKKVKRVTSSTISTAALLVVFGNWDGKYFCDEIFHETEYEQELENEWDVPIFLEGEYSEEERDRRLRRIKYSHDQAQANWDLFDEQFDNLRYVAIGDMRGAVIGKYLPLVEGLIANCTANGHYCLEDDDLVHELGHVWYFNLSILERDDFSDQWEEITGGNYCCSYLELLSGNCNFSESCSEYQQELATSSCYGTTNHWEDISETMKFVYVLNNPNWLIPNFPNLRPPFRDRVGRMRAQTFHIIPETVPRIIEKIELLCEYEAFSERERDHAIEVLENYLNRAQNQE